ncbi:MAG: hypothetical protein LBK99_25965 [Opitutaceae bacterium]|jgi:hypothetical protein|nr:hypothetical protein [Opitutaceae bacterium]
MNTRTGIDHLSPEEIRAEVERGGRFVYYPYCISLLVVTLRRSSGVTFVPAGRSSVIPGLGYALISLLFGWWGLPWGLIYTPQCLWQTLITGGVDVTDEVLNAIAPAPPPPLPGASQPPSQPQGRGEQNPDTEPVSPLEAHTRKAAAHARRRLAGSPAKRLAILAGGMFGIWVLVCALMKKQFDAVVLSGWPETYITTINGQPFALAPDAVHKMTLPAGKTVFTDPAGNSHEVVATTPFLAGPFPHRVVVINPDALAVWYQESTTYSTKPDRRANAGEDETGRHFRLFAGVRSEVAQRPNYIFEEFPATLMMNENTTKVRTRLALLERHSLPARLNIVASVGTREETRRYAFDLLHAFPDDRFLHSMALHHMPDEEFFAELKTLCEKRPVLVEAHRTYQILGERLHPEIDFAAEYEALAEASPDDGALWYLAGRAARGTALRAAALYKKALAVSKPERWAWIGLAASARDDVRPDEVLELIGQARAAFGEKAPVDTDMEIGLRRIASDAHLMKRDYHGALRDAEAVRKMIPRSFAFESLRQVAELRRLTASGEVSDESLLDGLKNELKSEGIPEKNIEGLEAYLLPALLYARGDEAAAAGKIRSGNDGVEGEASAYAAFREAVAERDHRKAAAALEKPDLVNALTLRLLALGAGDAEAAERHLGQALEYLRAGGGDERRMAGFLAGEVTFASEDVCGSGVDVETKRLALASLALTDPAPANRVLYRKTADTLNGSPAFPHLLVREVLEGIE